MANIVTLYNYTVPSTLQDITAHTGELWRVVLKSTWDSARDCQGSDGSVEDSTETCSPKWGLA